jgi:hypothetical protein
MPTTDILVVWRGMNDLSEEGREVRVVPADRECVSGVRERCDGPLEKVVFV